ncbi:SMP-30/gluconolactonase/LRE family protein [Sinomicrobium sp.]
MRDWEVLTNIKSLCGEGPVWDSETSSIYWIDVVGGDIHRYNTKSNSQKSIHTGQKIGAIAQCSSGHLIAALKKGLFFVDFERGYIKTIVNPESDRSGNRFNDGKCDPNGRFWVGTMDDGNNIKNAGSLYTLERDLTVLKKYSGLTISNGMVWSVDKRSFYLIDTPTQKVMAFDYDNSSGDISNKRDIISIPKGEGSPDGMTIDNEGMLWISHWDGWKVSRWNPHTGTQLFEIKLPVSRVTSCTFGGEKLEDLYITSAKVGLTHEEMAQQPLAGSLFVVKKSGFKGLPSNIFDNRKSAMDISSTEWQSLQSR